MARRKNARGEYSDLRITMQQDFGNEPMRLTLEQSHDHDGTFRIFSETFEVDAKAALRLVALLAPLAGHVGRMDGDR